MTKVIAVIGSGFGDEGKGLMTDFYSSQYDGDTAVVIRSNGGAQAGHTTITPEGDRHVFSHFGSGTFNKVPTFLSKHFVVNPMLFMKEHKAFIDEFGFKPQVYVDGRCLITTPYDMLVNQNLEKDRGASKHGSCGVGFGETLERQKRGYELTINDLLAVYGHSKDAFSDKLLMTMEEIRDCYIPERINMDKASDMFKRILSSSDLVADFIAATGYMLENTSISRPDYFRDDVIIFEGAQGLLLDMDYGYFPHVTRSNTGMKNVAQILSEIRGEHDVTVNYVTRHYTTRHGAGPLNVGLNPNIFHDNTNVHNKFQGGIRYAPLDYDLLQSITDKDFLNHAPVGAKKIMTMTWMDKLYDNDNKIFTENSLLSLSKKQFVEFAEENFDVLSYGETRKSIGFTDKAF